MKIQHLILLSLTGILLLTACRKDPITERNVSGQILEFNTNIPIENAEVLISTCRSSGGLTSCQFDQRLLTDANGQFSTTFNIEEIGRYAVLTVTADKYFESTEYILDPGKDNELEVILDPHAWLKLKVKNVAPAEETDMIFLSSLISTNPGSSEEYGGANVDLDYTIQKRGNRDLRLGWNTYEQGILVERLKDTVYLIAHDTLYYEINY